jgi:DNA-directed RNA polymerase subunit RPC12/RpoP
VVKILAATCPRCGAGIELPSDLRKAHCVYCGASIIIGADGTQRAECRICDGYGRLEPCRACDGTGTCNWSKVLDMVLDHTKAMYISKGEAHCDHGKCSACDGTGKSGMNLPCVYCNGNGFCPKCLGTGKCGACHGVGTTPNPRGSETCYMCHGDGIVDLQRASVRFGDRCPVCRMSLVSAGNFCQYCGLARRCPRCGKDWSGDGDTCEACGYRRGTKP